MNAAIHLDKPTPYRPTVDGDDHRLPDSFRNSRFLYVHYPEGWSYSPQYGFLPELSEIVIRPGVNGVDKDGRMQKAIGGAIQKGGTTINPADARLGQWKNHIASYATLNGKHWCFVAAKFDILPGGRVSQRDTSAAYAEFRAYLRDNAIVSPMEEAVLNKLLEIEQRGYERAVKDAAKNPHLNARADERKARIDAIKAAWVDYTGGDEAIGEFAPAASVESDDLAAELAAAHAAPIPAGTRRARKVTVDV